QLAAHPRLGRIGGLGLPLAAVRTAHGGGDTQGQESTGAALRRGRQQCRGHRATTGRRAGECEAVHRELVPPGWTRLRWLGGAGTAMGRLSERESGIVRRSRWKARANTPLSGW